MTDLPEVKIEQAPNHLRSLMAAARQYTAHPEDRRASAKLMLIRVLEIAWQELPMEEVGMTFLHSATRKLGK